MPEPIELLMLKEHARLRQMMADFESADIFSKRSKFNVFKWNIDKHFFVEEKAIFSLFVFISGQDTFDLFDLLKEHGNIMQQIGEIEKNLDINPQGDIIKLKDLLINHADFEDRVFYPKLDELLEDDKKAELAKRIKEIIPE